MIDTKSLRAKYNSDGSLLRQQQLRMVEMLKYFDNLCQENGIKYWLSSGSCLGAVRHTGFIPWDDDMDVEMLREDYQKLEKVFKETDKYVLQTHKNDKFYDMPFAKMRDKNSQVYNSLYKYKGVFIDIFVLEYIGKALSLFSAYFRRISLFFYEKTKKRNIFSPLFFASKFLAFYIIYPLCRLLSKLSKTNCLRHTFGVGWTEKIRMIDDIFPLKKMDFEGIEVPVPNKYDNYLTRLYGNYMRIPDENSIQKPHREFLILN